jgi:hypothetical protein
MPRLQSASTWSGLSASAFSKLASASAGRLRWQSGSAISENPKQMFGTEVVRLRRKDCFVMMLGLIEPALLMELYGLL